MLKKVSCMHTGTARIWKHTSDIILWFITGIGCFVALVVGPYFLPFWLNFRWIITYHFSLSISAGPRENQLTDYLTVFALRGETLRTYSSRHKFHNVILQLGNARCVCWDDDFIALIHHKSKI